MDSLEQLKQAQRRFAEDRDWDQFHSPKNLVMALAGEVGELSECFQWLSEEKSLTLGKDELQAVREEAADILLYLVRLADKLDIDLVQAAREKILLNAAKYPVSKARGTATKYTKL